MPILIVLPSENLFVDKFLGILILL